MNLNYVVLYSDKKTEDNIIIKNMFIDNYKINICWTDIDYNNNIKIIDNLIKEKKLQQIIFSGFELGWERLVKYIKNSYSKIKVKVICNTSEALLYYDYERNNFFEMLKLQKEQLIDNIAFFKRGQYELYKSLGYNCCYLMQNFILDKQIENNSKLDNKKINIGIYPLNYTWDKNIFNQLCIGKFVDNSIINYNKLDNRMEEFLNTMGIENNYTKINEITVENIIKELLKNDINVACSFTEYCNPIFFISMELGIPCIIGDNSELFKKEEKIKEFIITDAEDNPILNSNKLINCLNNKIEIMELYKDWKKEYNIIAKNNINEFINI